MTYREHAARWLALRAARKNAQQQGCPGTTHDELERLRASYLARGGTVHRVPAGQADESRWVVYDSGFKVRRPGQV